METETASQQDIGNTPSPQTSNAQTSSTRLVLSLDEAATTLGLSRFSVVGLIKSGKLRAARVGRKYLIPARALEQFVNCMEGQLLEAGEKR